MNIAAGHISIKYGRGANYVTVSVASNQPLLISSTLIRLGTDAIVTGGLRLELMKWEWEDLPIRALSTRNDSPQTASRPFDVDRWVCFRRR